MTLRDLALCWSVSWLRCGYRHWSGGLNASSRSLSLSLAFCLSLKLSVAHSRLSIQKKSIACFAKFYAPRGNPTQQTRKRKHSDSIPTFPIRNWGNLTKGTFGWQGYRSKSKERTRRQNTQKICGRQIPTEVRNFLSLNNGESFKGIYFMVTRIISNILVREPVEKKNRHWTIGKSMRTWLQETRSQCNRTLVVGSGGPWNHTNFDLSW